MMIETKRKVAVYEFHREPGARGYTKRFVDYGMFHQFGVNFEEFEHGAGNYSTAIVEMSDGSVKNVDVELIHFVVDEKENGE